MARITTQTTITGRSIGSVRNRNTRQVVVPSIAAASNGSFGRLCRPASSSSVNHGVHSQMSVSRMMPKALQRCTSHGWPSRPIASSTALTMPNWSLKIQRDHDRGDRPGATISGTSRIVCTSFCPRNGRLSSSASASPATSAPGDAQDHEQEGVRQHDVEERRVRDHPDKLHFLVDDKPLTSAVATVSITVTPVNDAPIAYSQNLTNNEDIALAITLSAYDPDGPVTNFTLVTALTNGTLSGTLPNLVYQPPTELRGLGQLYLSVTTARSLRRWLH